MSRHHPSAYSSSNSDASSKSISCRASDRIRRVAGISSQVHKLASLNLCRDAYEHRLTAIVLIDGGSIRAAGAGKTISSPRSTARRAVHAKRARAVHVAGNIELVGWIRVTDAN